MPNGVDDQGESQGGLPAIRVIDAVAREMADTVGKALDIEDNCVAEPARQTAFRRDRYSTMPLTAIT